MSTFSEQEFLRYSRQIQLPQIGAEGQARLKQSCVLIVGCGGLGAPVSLYLAAAGVGKLILADGDDVELSNLQRQITFTEADIGHNKALCTANHLQARNSDIAVIPTAEHLNADNCAGLIEQVDLVLDCTDSVPTRYLINQVCKQLGKTWIYASVFQFSGQCAVFKPDKACYHCLFPDAQSQAIDCASAGVLGSLPGFMGTMQATLAVRCLLGQFESTQTNLMLIETGDFSTQSIGVAPASDCPFCHSDDKLAATASNCNSDITSTNPASIDCENFDQIRKNKECVLLDVRSEAEHSAFSLASETSNHLLIPVDELVDRLAKGELPLNKNSRYLVYCQIGQRSQRASEALRAQGYDAVNLEGGLQNLLKHRQSKHLR